MHLIHVYISQVLNVDETSRPRSRLPSNKTVETNPKISTPIYVRKKNQKGKRGCVEKCDRFSKPTAFLHYTDRGYNEPENISFRKYKLETI